MHLVSPVDDSFYYVCENVKGPGLYRCQDLSFQIAVLNQMRGEETS
jgi:hypothetical protein